MGLLKRIKGSSSSSTTPKSPREVAEKILEHLPRKNAHFPLFVENDMISRCDVSGPGFINIYLKKEWVSNTIQKVLSNGCIPPPLESSKNIVIDYSSPNIAKDMHVGHLRSTIIGDCLARTLEFCGHNVTRVNHVGDWGTQFGMLIAHLQDISPDFENSPPSIRDLTAFYKQAKVKFEEDSHFQKRAHQEVVNLQQGVERNIRMWKLLCSQSEQMFKKVYSMLGVDSRLQTVGESFYNPLLGEMVNELTAKGLITDE